MQKKFSVLRFSSNVFKTLGIIAAVFAFIAAGLFFIANYALLFPQLIGVIGYGGLLAELFGALLVLAGGLFSALCLYSVGELINLLIAVEENTRASALALVKERNPAGNG